VGFVQKVLESTVAKEAAEVQDNVAQAMVLIKTLRQDVDRARAERMEQKEVARTTNTNLQTLSDEFTKANTITAMIDQRLAETTNSMKATRQSLAETNAVALRIHEDHKNTKGQLQATQEALKRCSGHVKQVHEGLDSAVVKLKNTHDLSQRTAAGLTQARDQLDKANSQVRSLSEAHEMVSAATTALHAKIEDTHATVQAVQAGLKDTNSVVLPNLRMNIPRPWSTMSDMSTTTTTRKPMSARASPTLKKSAPNSPGVSGMLMATESELGDPFMP